MILVSEVGKEQRDPGILPFVCIEDALFTMCEPYPVPLEFTDTASILSSGFLEKTGLEK